MRMRSSDFELFLLRSARRKLLDHVEVIEGEFLPLAKAVVRAQVFKRPGAGSQTVVIVPDPPNLIEHHAQVIEALSKDYRVVCFELPGFGFSHPSAGFQFTVEEQTAAMIEVFEKLRVRDAILEMACLGAFVGLNVAQQRPDLIRKLVLLQLPSYREAQDWAKRADLMNIIGTPWLGQMFMHLGHTAVARRWYKAALPPGGARQVHRDYLPLTLEGFDRGACFCLASAYQTLHSQPTRRRVHLSQEAVVIWGTADPSHVATDRRSILELIPNARLVEFPGCGHFPSLEATERYLSILRAEDASVNARQSYRAALVS